LDKRRYQTLAGFKAKYRWPTSKEREGRKGGMEGQGVGRRERRGPTSKARKMGAGGSEGEGRLAPNLKTKLCACSSQHVASLPGPA